MGDHGGLTTQLTSSSFGRDVKLGVPQNKLKTNKEAQLGKRGFFGWFQNRWSTCHRCPPPPGLTFLRICFSSRLHRQSVCHMLVSEFFYVLIILELKSRMSNMMFHQTTKILANSLLCCVPHWMCPKSVSSIKNRKTYYRLTTSKTDCK